LDAFAADDPRIRPIHLARNGGIGAALNAAAAAATGDYLARMDADDMSVVYRFSEQLRLLEAEAEIGICGTGMWVLDPNDHIIMEIVRPSLHEDILRFCIGFGCPFVHGSVMMRRGVFESVGGYPDREEWACEDFELWFRVLSQTTGYNFPEPMYLYRQSPGGLSSKNMDRIACDTARVVEKFRDAFGHLVAQAPLSVPA
jgi:glycosyltransferase involved in cell wall biosynthesis